MPTKKISKKTASGRKPQSSDTAKIPVTTKDAEKPAAIPAQSPRSGAKPMQTVRNSNSAKYQKIKGILLQQKAALLTEAEVALNELPGQTSFPDMGDQASAETDTNFMLRLRGREQRLLKKIEEALERIENHTFGICDDCGLEIDVKRLEARPVTTMCIECKMHQEEDEKRREV